MVLLKAPDKAARFVQGLLTVAMRLVRRRGVLESNLDLEWIGRRFFMGAGAERMVGRRS
jgi:hypothetical protein